MHIGDRIKFLRISNDMTQDELGALLGVKKAPIQKIRIFRNRKY